MSDRAGQWNIFSFLDFVSKYISDDPVHGMPHVQRVYSNFSIFELSEPAFDPAIRDAAAIAVFLHDIGRKTKAEGHAAESAKILQKLFENELRWVKNKEWILYAVTNHSKGIDRKPETKPEFVLALLCLFDHMDIIGPVGVYRDTIYWSCGQPYRIPVIPVGLIQEESKYLKEKLLSQLYLPSQITIKSHQELAAGSLIECLVYNTCITQRIIEPVRSLVRGVLLAKIEQMVRFSQDYAEGLIRQLL